jgi:hypothetical protein
MRPVQGGSKGDTRPSAMVLPLPTDGGACWSRHPSSCGPRTAPFAITTWRSRPGVRSGKRMAGPPTIAGGRGHELAIPAGVVRGTSNVCSTNLQA